MKVQSHIALLCILLVSAPGTYAQQQSAESGQNSAQPSDTTPRLESEAPRWYSRFTNPFNPKIAPPVNVSNSTRLDSLVRAGNLYLSLADAIALALENNIDIEVFRYQYPLSDTDLYRAKSGAPIRGVSTAVANGATGFVAGTTGTISNAGTAGTTGGSLTGPLVSLDPVLTGTINWGHFTTPQNNTITTGTTALISRNEVYNFGVSQGFMSGATATFSYNNTNTFQNAPRNSINPYTTSFLDLTVTQPLLQGFGLSVNNRNIRIAKNNLKVTEYAFEQQVISTVNTVIQAYWNLVTFISSVDVANQSLAQSTKLYEDNKKQVEIGTLAPIAIIQAEAQMATDQQTLVNAQTNVLQQETAIKNLLSRNGVASTVIANVHIIPTDHIEIPDVEPVTPVQDLVAEALDNRPDLAQSRVQVENAKINLTGTRNNMLPQLNLVADARNAGLAGTVNTLPLPPGSGGFTTPPSPFVVGGYSDVLSQIFLRNFPTYSVGATLNIPLRNRSAQADMATAQLQYRQTELGLQKAINQIRVDVQTALTALTQSRAQYAAALKGVDLEIQTLDAEQKKLALGASTPYNVILIQRDVATAQQSLVTARAAYAQSRVLLDQAVGMILQRNNIQIDEARSGHVSKAPDRIPDVNGGLPPPKSNAALR
ncbi:MAG TPA: TolC family protein [Bryobacteraceae bacterium]|nr:TolC family protein [Bryobacteraceae bacterium]